MASKSEKMYKDSPTLKRGEDGKMAATKKGDGKSPEKSAGPAGETGHPQEVMDMEQKHAKERMDLYHKHEKEHLGMMQKHMAAGKDEKAGSMGGSTAEKKGDADKGGKPEEKKEGAMADKDKK